MREKDLPIDLTKHKVYTKNAQKCVQKLLHRSYDAQKAAELWEKIQLQYCEYLKDEPALAGLKITTSIYDPILIFAWYAVIPDKPPLEDVQQDIYQSFFGSFEAMGKVFNLNRKLDNKLAAGIFQKVNDIRVEEIKSFRNPSAWAIPHMTRRTASSATASLSVRTQSLPSATTWRTCFRSCATATIWPCRRSMRR